MVKSDILIIFQTFINVCNWLLPSYASRRNGCVHDNTHANSHHRYIHSSIYFQMSPRKTQNWRVRGASGNPQDSVQLFVESPPVAAFNKDPDQEEKAKSCGGATHSVKLLDSWARLTYCFNVVMHNSGGAVSSAGWGREETGQNRLPRKGPTSEAVTVKCLEGGVKKRSHRPVSPQKTSPFNVVNNNKYVDITQHPSSVWFLIQMWN